MQVLIPVGKILRTNKSQKVKRPSRKYIEVITVANFDFWFMGFLTYRKTLTYNSNHKWSNGTISPRSNSTRYFYVNWTILYFKNPVVTVVYTFCYSVLLRLTLLQAKLHFVNYVTNAICAMSIVMFQLYDDQPLGSNFFILNMNFSYGIKIRNTKYRINRQIAVGNEKVVSLEMKRPHK